MQQRWLLLAVMVLTSLSLSFYASPVQSASKITNALASATGSAKAAASTAANAVTNKAKLIKHSAADKLKGLTGGAPAAGHPAVAKAAAAAPAVAKPPPLKPGNNFLMNIDGSSQKLTLYMRAGCQHCDSVIKQIDEVGLKPYVKIKDVAANPKYAEKLQRLTGKTQVPMLRVKRYHTPQMGLKEAQGAFTNPKFKDSSKFTLYSTKACKYCDDVKKFAKDNNFEGKLKVKSIDENLVLAHEMKGLTGQQGVPVLLAKRDATPILESKVINLYLEQVGRHQFERAFIMEQAKQQVNMILQQLLPAMAKGGSPAKAAGAAATKAAGPVAAKAAGPVAAAKGAAEAAKVKASSIVASAGNAAAAAKGKAQSVVASAGSAVSSATQAAKGKAQSIVAAAKGKAQAAASVVKQQVVK